jgi:hypothetical protein
MLSYLQVRKLITAIFVCCLPSMGTATGTPPGARINLPASEDSLKLLFSELFSAGTPEERKEINGNITGILGRVLLHEDSFEYPFDSLGSLGRITSSDKRVRIFTWNYSDSPVDHKYSGFIQYRENDSIYLHRLEGGERKKEGLESRVFGAEDWYGALYYQVHDVVYSGRTYYTLIGFDFNDVFSSIKIVDILTFDEGAPVLGAPMFQFRDGIRNRVIFEYSARAVMLLRYVPERDMIIYDHLAPGSPRLRGQYRYYGPVFSYDGLRFERGRWVHQPDVDWRP